VFPVAAALLVPAAAEGRRAGEASPAPPAADLPGSRTAAESAP
jgi:hypothetical protein